MFNHITNVSQKSLMLAALCLGFGAHVAYAAQPAANYGSVAPQTAAAKLISISPQTRYINVDNGETVTFVHGHQMFTWNFRTLRNTDSFKLADIAPAGFDADGVEVYVASDPLYR